MQYGIDVSCYNPIDWEQVTGIDFAIIKVTNRRNKIEQGFIDHYAGATKKRIPVGVYKYVYAQNVEQAQAEAEAIVNIIRDCDIKCGVWLDMENASLKKLDKHRLNSIIVAESNIFEEAGYRVGIYCNHDWYANVLDSKFLSNNYPFWIARYPLNDRGKANNLNSILNPEGYAIMWQYSSKGQLPFCKGNLDLDVSFVDLPQYMGVDYRGLYYPKYTGNATFSDALKSLGIDGSYSNRKHIAKVNAISNYSGTYQQNMYLFNLLKTGLLKKA